jgi:hypothetical protein
MMLDLEAWRRPRKKDSGSRAGGAARQPRSIPRTTEPISLRSSGRSQTT